MYNISANTTFKGKTLIFLPTCHSTNDYARNYIKDKEIKENTIIITPEQTAGKGQLGATWESEPGKNLTFSYIITPKSLHFKQQFFLAIITSLALVDTLKSHCMESLKIKWPNDIYLNNKKLCGILIQNTLQGSRLNHSVIGIGLNINQTKFSVMKATSLALETGVEFKPYEILDQFLAHFDALFQSLSKGEFDKLQDEYTQNLYLFQENHLFYTKNSVFKGKIGGVTESGQLIVETEKGPIHFNNKEIQFTL